MSNTVGYSLGACTAGVKYNLTQGEDATGNTVGYALGGCSGCWNDDYRDRRYWAQIPRSATTVTGGTDYYGALAPTLKFQGGGTYRDICPTVCYCEGPVAEGVTVTKYLDRYETRWMALLEGGLIYYGRVDGTLIQAPLDLFPDPLPDTATHIALSFDANARPVFAYEDEGTIYVRRYVADVPTTYSWTGTNPCLFFNGVINYDDSLTDVVCYYLTASGGSLYARFQRENFGVANLVLEDPGLDSLMAVDRGRGALASFMVVELSGKRVFASVYPPWPVLAGDTATATVALQGVGDYSFEIVHAGTYAETATATVGLTGEGLYELQIQTITPNDSTTATVEITGVGAYELQIVVAPTATDLAQPSITLYGIGEYSLQIVSGSAYTDSATATITLYGTGTYELE